jgi:hypothetical protein
MAPSKSLYDLLEYLISRPWQMGEEAQYFYTGIIPDAYSGARLPLYLLSTGAGVAIEPEYLVDLRCEGDELELWYGWQGQTHHLAQSWRLGTWRQEVNEPLGQWGLSSCSLGVTRQVATVEEARQEVEHALRALFQRLHSARQTGHYRLTWAEIAAILVQFAKCWNEQSQHSSTALVQDTYAHLAYGDRGQPLELQIHNSSSNAPLLTLKTARDHWGWRLDVFTTLCPKLLSLQPVCPWIGGIAFTGESVGPPWMRPCPLGHRHQEAVEMTAPWSLFEFFEQDWLPSLNDRHEHWGTATYQAVPYGQRTHIDPSGRAWRWLAGVGLPTPTYRGTDAQTGYEYWQLGGADFVIIVEPQTLRVVAYLAGNGQERP